MPNGTVRETSVPNTDQQRKIFFDMLRQLNTEDLKSLPARAERPWSSKSSIDKINQMFRDVWSNPYKGYYPHPGLDIGRLIR